MLGAERFQDAEASLAGDDGDMTWETQVKP